jgi:hypothetical protein
MNEFQTPPSSPPPPASSIRRNRRLRRCTICRQTGHNRRTCPLSICPDCDQIGHNSGSPDCERQVRTVISITNSDSPNNTTPLSIEMSNNINRSSDVDIAIQSETVTDIEDSGEQYISDEELARRIQIEEMRNYTNITITERTVNVTIKNNLRSCVYLYIFDYHSGWWINMQDNFVDEYKEKSFISQTNFYQYIILNHDYYPKTKLPLSEINKDHIIKSFDIRENSPDNIHIELSCDDNSMIDKWKEAALKTSYLIHQLNRLGANKNPNYEAILDMFQDIEFPEHTEQDKERSGVSSHFTNITQITGINEPTR